MTEKTVDVLAIGNAIVDVIADADDRFLAENGLAKGGMRLIDAAEAERLLSVACDANICQACRPQR